MRYSTPILLPAVLALVILGCAQTETTEPDGVKFEPVFAMGGNEVGVQFIDEPILVVAYRAEAYGPMCVLFLNGESSEGDEINDFMRINRDGTEFIHVAEQDGVIRWYDYPDPGYFYTGTGTWSFTQRYKEEGDYCCTHRTLHATGFVTNTADPNDVKKLTCHLADPASYFITLE